MPNNRENIGIGWGRGRCQVKKHIGGGLTPVCPSQMEFGAGSYHDDWRTT